MNKELFEKIQSCKSAEEVQELFRKENAKLAAERAKSDNAELSDAELNGVVGGASADPECCGIGELLNDCQANNWVQPDTNEPLTDYQLRWLSTPCRTCSAFYACQWGVRVRLTKPYSWTKD